MSTAPVELAEPHLLGMLASVGLDVEYVRAEKDTLYRLDEHGAESAVLDFIGGYGSVILGHNNPEIVRCAQELLAAGTPVHAQFSRRTEANQVAVALNSILRRETGVDEPYLAVFGNSGAEAIEIAMKHAELSRVARASTMVAEVEQNIAATAEAVAAGSVSVDPTVFSLLGSEATFGGVVAEMSRLNAELLDRAPLFLALENSFHGKLVGSVQVTYNTTFRTPFKSLATQARFASVDQPGSLGKIIESERVSLLDLVVEEQVVKVVARPFPIFVAMLLEPIQGEGGITAVSRELAEEVQRECRAIGCPVIVDEVQTGVGRTGAFFASSHIGLQGDYYTIAKSIGGGIAKTSVTLIRESMYMPQFELVHSSTFAKDSFSSSIALKVVELLEAADGAAYRRVAERGDHLMRVLDAMRADFPEVVKDVRGKGLLVGLEFHDPTESLTPVYGDQFPYGMFGYLISGHLLRDKGIRIAPTASAANTLRIEPSVYIEDHEIAALGEALRHVCATLRSKDPVAIMGLFHLG